MIDGPGYAYIDGCTQTFHDLIVNSPTNIMRHVTMTYSKYDCINERDFRVSIEALLELYRGVSLVRTVVRSSFVQVAIDTFSFLGNVATSPE